MDIGYLQFCKTDLQRDLVKWVAGGGTMYSYSVHHKRNRSVIRRRSDEIKKCAARAGYCPEKGMMGETIPDGFELAKSTVHYRDGNMVQRWDRAVQDAQEIEAKRIEAITDAAQSIKPAKLIAGPKKTKGDLLTLYTLADVHLGMYADAQESGEPYDMEIAERCIMDAFDEMLARSPDAEVGVLSILGDWAHFDGLIAKTPKHGHPLDAAARCYAMTKASARIGVALCNKMLAKHQTCRAVILQGNHDEASSIWLQVLLCHVMSKNPRIIIPEIASPFDAMLHGKTMLAFHHGHKCKDEGLRDVFAGDLRWREMWGQAEYTYIHTGHCHSNYVVERGGALIERHPTLSARDAYASRAGYMSRRAARAITYHRDGGEHSRITVQPGEK